MFLPLHHHHHHHHHRDCRVFGPLTSAVSINVLEVFREVVLGYERVVIPHGEILNTLKYQLQQPGRFFPLLISNIHSLLILSVDTAFLC